MSNNRWAHAYYNENDPKAAAWLRELIKEGHIASGDVDERSIEEVKPGELTGYTQCHFFAGIGGWSYALRLAGWPDSRPVWTGSCPCQPFSVANSRRKAIDHRDLFAVWRDLIWECRPTVVFGEQVASPLGLAWFDTVRTDLETEGYAVGGADLCAAGVGAPHIRQRLYWVALAGGERQQGVGLHVREGQSCDTEPQAGWCSEAGIVGNPSSFGGGRIAGEVSAAQARFERRVRYQPDEPEFASLAGELADAHSARSQGRGERRLSTDQRSAWESSLVGCRDGKWRPVEPGSFPLAHGVPHRVGLLRGYGNAIVPQLAAAFIEAAEGLT